jgi:hypothetical protein
MIALIRVNDLEIQIIFYDPDEEEIKEMNKTKRKVILT